MRYLEASNLFDFLNRFSKNNPKNHTFNPCRFTDSDDVCDFSESDLVKVDNSLSISCNCRCKFCFKHKENNGELTSKNLPEPWEDSQLTKQAYLNTFYRLKGSHLNMLRATDNGEPLIYKKELLEFLSTCTNEDFKVFGITTNGELLDKDFIDKLSEYSKKGNFNVQIQVSLNAFNADTRRKIMKSKRDIEEIKDLIKYMKLNTNFWVHASIVVVPENIEEVSLLDNWCKENKVCFISSPAYGTEWFKLGAPLASWKPYN